MWIRIIYIWCPACGLLLHGIAKRNSSHEREREKSRGMWLNERKISSPLMLSALCLCFGGPYAYGSKFAWKRPYSWPASSGYHAQPCRIAELAIPNCKPWSELRFVFCSKPQSRLERPDSCRGSPDLSGQSWFSKLGCAQGERGRRGQQGQAPATHRQDGLNRFPAAEISLGKILGCVEPKPRAQA